jgi:hypothetical protein
MELRLRMSRSSQKVIVHEGTARPLNELARYDAMCRAIDAAYEVDEVKDIRDRAKALEVYAQQAQNVEAERKACEIRLRAERKAGQLLAGMDKAKAAPGNQYTGPVKPSDRSTPTLRDLGVSKQQSSDWQKLAAVPQEEFDAALADKATMPTTAGIIRATAEPKQNPVNNEALWLWGCLLDFERKGFLSGHPADVLSSMTSPMLDDVHKYAPRIAAWLGRIGDLNGSGKRNAQTDCCDLSDYRVAQ